MSTLNSIKFLHRIPVNVQKSYGEAGLVVTDKQLVDKLLYYDLERYTSNLQTSAAAGLPHVSCSRRPNSNSSYPSQ
ncbi:MAG: hypothetical protein HUJ51_05630 [Eggerthellaceae bacterium]|nr:hypothetical protein [Eggerthellaceae bacterium]